MHRLPTLFLSHGSPMNAAGRTASSDAWATLAHTVRRPRAVLGTVAALPVLWRLVRAAQDAQRQWLR
mgnify:CR=1 FL=1